MERKVRSRYLRIAPRKLRLVADLVRGRRAVEAKAILRFLPKRGAMFVSKAIDAAVASIEEASPRADLDRLVVQEIYVDPGPVLKRFLPRAHGRATPIRKRTSHLTVVVRA